MNRKLILYIAFLVLVTGLVIVVDANKPRPINWRPTYAVKDKIPLGLYVLDKEAPALFKGSTLTRFATTPYEYFDPLYNYEEKQYDAKGTFLNISETSELDRESVKELIYFAEHGNTVFLSSKQLPQQLLDTLGIKMNSMFTFKDSVALSFADKRAGNKKYYINEGVGLSYFDSVQPATTKVLGYQEAGAKQHANFIRVTFGNGRFVLHTQPAAFSNFHLLKGNHHEYAQKLAAYIKPGDIYWHAWQFPGGRSGVSSSPLRYILSQPALKAALYIGLLGLLVFIFFNAKRKQRIIPVVVPLKNTTVDFTKTIGNLYYQEGSHHTIIDKKIIYFLEKIRNEYLIDTYSLDDAFIEKLHLKTGRPLEEIRNIIRIIIIHRHKFESTEADVIEVNNAIEKLML